MFLTQDIYFCTVCHWICKSAIKMHAKNMLNILFCLALIHFTFVYRSYWSVEDRLKILWMYYCCNGVLSFKKIFYYFSYKTFFRQTFFRYYSLDFLMMIISDLYIAMCLSVFWFIVIYIYIILFFISLYEFMKQMICCWRTTSYMIIISFR